MKFLSNQTTFSIKPPEQISVDIKHSRFSLRDGKEILSPRPTSAPVSDYIKVYVRNKFESVDNKKSKVGT